MEALLFIGIIFIVILLIVIKNGVEAKTAHLSKKMDELKHEIKQIKISHAIPSKVEPEAENFQQLSGKPSVTIIPEIKEAVIPPIENKQKEPVETPLQNQEEKTPIEDRPPIQRPPSKKPVLQKSFIDSFFENNPDLEKFIGENLINKIGIAILVLGIGFFVKYAIDQDWINEIGRVFIGIIAGGILVGLAHRTRNSFRSFSSVLVGGGLAVFYFTITIAFHEYHIFSQSIAFGIMVIITAFSILLSITYDRKELAVLAIIGGFASPFMVSTGAGNYVVLFTYLSILNVGMLVLAYYKGWHIINIICYVFTIFIFSGWLYKEIDGKENPPYIGALFFATLFYLLFFLMNIVNNIKENKKFIFAQVSILLSNAFLYYSAGMIILENVNEGLYKGLFTALIGVFNFIFAYILYKNKKADSNLIYMLIGLVLTFVSLSAPVQLQGNYITLFWAAEAVLLLWLSQKSGILLIKGAAALVMVLMLVSLMMDWSTYSYATGLGIIINKNFITSVVAIASVTATIFLLRKEKDIIYSGIDKNILDNILKFALAILIYTAGILELNYQLIYYIGNSDEQAIIMASYHLISAIVLLLGIGKKSRELELISCGIGMVAITSFLFYFNRSVIEVRNSYLLKTDTNIFNFLYQYVDFILCIVLLTLCFSKARRTLGIKSNEGKIFLITLSFFIVFLLSAELDHLVVLLAYKPGASIIHILMQNHKIGYPILWGISSLIFMVIGMRKKYKTLRIISLSLFLIILLKLFLLDIRGISEGGKIAAFISLGILLLVISFMYQKLKKLVLDDELRASTSKTE